ncbi:T9SS type A sorting domain-containing protein [Flavobacterium sp. xlx-214]|uniref:T9SS type A sorting domain-containing protein n=1 Tax=unclassified Flavobacterium TaxID=196869 RepID=UPI0013D6B154|nr:MULTISPECIES: T9SS type A sorting domain-containing protein [unclassified Flavobacterium]MBA5791526.1 T9SS type A sorting domain-containing protein [Flavobacterium sp. xlx-221]QMI83324.1 T9SS type A sorting domain-containing protein [Flavobacterium sp. xlx-214]
MKKKLLFLFFGLSVFSGYSQKVAWERTIGGEHSEYLFDMVPTLDYGFLLAGSSLSDKTGLKKQKGQGNLDYFLWKMDKNGEEEWQLSFGGEGQDILKSIYPTADMGYILGGYSNSGKNDSKFSENYGKNDLWIVKINARGDQEWQQAIGGEGDDRLVQIKQVKGGGYLAIATTNSTKSDHKKDDKYGGLDYWIIKLDKSGKVEWEKTYGGLYNDEPKSILETQKGFIIGGISNSPASGTKQKDNFGGYDQWILAIDDKGNLLNEYVFGGENDDDLNEILLTESKDGYIITGSTYTDNNNKGNLTAKSEKASDFLVVTTDLTFQPINQYTYDLKGSEILTSTTFTPSKTLLLSGYKIDEKSNKKSYVSIQVNQKGEQVWEKELSTSGDDLLRKAVVTRDGGFVFAGNSTGKNAEYKKTTQGRDDYWVVKLNSKEKVDQPEIKLEAFPNPTEGFTQIVINHEYKEGVVNVFDLNGRLLHTEALKYDMVAINLANYATGTYVINIKTDVFNGSVKVIKK